jgi:antitoxin (DNA-binding transcriptional repressor) of toxin-antitoxin stability system
MTATELKARLDEVVDRVIDGAEVEVTTASDRHAPRAGDRPVGAAALVGF